MTPFDAVHHMAFVYGKIGDGKNVLARLHRADIIRDVFGGAQSGPRRARSASRRKAAASWSILRDGTAGVPVQPSRAEAEPSSEASRAEQWREVGLGAQILQRPRHLLDPAARPRASCTYVGLGRLRHRDRGDRIAGRLSAAPLRRVPVAVPPFAANPRRRIRRCATCSLLVVDRGLAAAL